MIKKTMAVALLSGGLDSIIAARLIMEQGIECIGVYFSSPLWSNEKKEKNFIRKVSEENNFEIKIVPVGEDYIGIIKNPRHGHGKNINPCLDCKIYMLTKAKSIMESLSADFIVTGEVLGQRPMSQHRNAFNLIEKYAGLSGKIIRPLSARILPPTIAVQDELIDNEKMADIQGRSRHNQYALAEKFGIKTYGSPAGGCLLTEVTYAKKLRDLFLHNEKITIEDLKLLKIGRHFRYKNVKIITGRNEAENGELMNIKTDDDWVIEVPNYGSPCTIVQSSDDVEVLHFACQVTAYSSDCKLENVLVKCAKNDREEFINVNRLDKAKIDKYNISLN